MQPIRIMSRPPSRRKKEKEADKPVQMNIYQSNTYTKELSCLHFDDEPRVQERQQAEDQQSYVFVFCSLSINFKQQRGALAQT